MTQSGKVVLFVVIAFITGIGIIVVLATGLVLYKFSRQHSDPSQRLSGKQETLEVTYIHWACACANYLDVRHYQEHPNEEVSDTACFFIEAANPDKVVPESFENEDYWDCNVRLTGQFYEDKGIPESYVSPTSETPERARVFRYEAFELVPKGK
ncbi:MAG: hypothetical protein RLZZ519_1511 [Bacteroidota bacterium]|jgi:hypothetical protein